MNDEQLEELSKGAWVLVKALCIGIGCTVAICLVLWAAIAVCMVVNATLGAGYTSALVLAMLIGLFAAVAWLTGGAL